MSGEVGHFEIPADNTERARKFYSATFGWKMTQMPDMDYTMVATGPTGDRGMPKEAGYIGGGIGQRGGPLACPVVTIIVDDIDAAAKKIEKNGGKMIREKESVGANMGFAAYFKDSEGNVVGLYQAPKM
ncbi:MAG: VOC family protein [Thermoplasmata archaeon]